MVDLVYADPPWEQGKGGKKRVRPNSSGKPLDYSTLPVEKIKEILVQEEFQGRILFLWTIDKYLCPAQKMAEEMGYHLHARLIWDKVTGIPAAFTVRFAHEYLLWFYKKPFIPVAKETRGRYTTVFREQVTKHSKKPNIAYEIIESLYPNLTKLELFARNYRMGWQSFGNQLPQTIPLKDE